MIEDLPRHPHNVEGQAESNIFVLYNKNCRRAPSRKSHSLVSVAKRTREGPDTPGSHHRKLSCPELVPKRVVGRVRNSRIEEGLRQSPATTCTDTFRQGFRV